MKKYFALVDCNNFYVSCERVFQPGLNGRPVVVLSNNDGCIISRSNEAKALGITMGAPYFKCKKFLEKHGVEVFSSNYALYGDFSRRVMAVLHRLEPEIEVYSIDEAFLHLYEMDGKTPAAYGREIRQRVRRCTGIPISIGIGPTKTLAKIAGRIAKRNAVHGGSFAVSREEVDSVLRQCDVSDVWGIGRRQTEWLHLRGIRTAFDLKNCDDGWLRRNLTVTGLRAAMELRGVSCIELDDCPVSKKSIASSKSFGYQVESLQELREALATYVEQAAVKLRTHRSLANSLQASLSTNRFSTVSPHYSGRLVVTLPEATASSTVLIRHALEALDRLYKPGLRYQKTGIVLFGLVPESYCRPGLFSIPDRKSGPLMAALDTINSRWGRHTIQHAVAGFGKPWRNRQEMMSQAYTTRWQDLPLVKA
ncbi:MAG: Y-family DNA polymerase [Pseudomonadota bacterium]